MIWFTEIGNTSGPLPIIFQFFPHELPEEISFGKTTVLRKLRYFGGFHTNQIIGTYPKELEWSGHFFGNNNIGGKMFSAKERYTQLEGLMGRPLRVGFPQPGMELQGIPGEGPYSGNLTDADFNGGFKGVFIIEECTPKEKDYEDVEYSIKLVPHQRQEKVRPTETKRVLVEPSPQRIEQAQVRIQNRGVPRGKNQPRGGTGVGNRGGNSTGAARPVPPEPSGTFREEADRRLLGQ